MKEEQRLVRQSNGMMMGSDVHEFYRDSNASSIIRLYCYGSDRIVRICVTLLIGICISMFTAITLHKHY